MLKHTKTNTHHHKGKSTLTITMLFFDCLIYFLYGKSLQIPLPPLQEQEQIAKHLDSVFEKTKALKELYAKELQDYEDLKQSLLDKAFKGGL